MSDLVSKPAKKNFEKHLTISPGYVRIIMSKGGVTIGKYFDKDLGFGDIIAIDGDQVLVRFDADPWCPKWMPARA